jgi:hypothetical protein
LLGSAKVRRGKAEHPNASFHQGIALVGSSPNRPILSEDNPALGSGVFQPFLVAQFLRATLAVDVRHRINPQTGAPQSEHDAFTETSVDKELQRIVALGHRRDYRTRRGDTGLSRRSRRHAYHVLDLVRWNTEVIRELVDGIAGSESVDEVLDSGATISEDWQPEPNTRIHDHFGCGVGREADGISPSVPTELDALQVALHNLGELTLLGTDNRQVHQVFRTGAVAVVEQHLSAVGVEALRREGVLDADFLAEYLYGRSNALQGESCLPEAGKYEGLGESDERNGRLAVRRREGCDQRMSFVGGMRPSVDGRPAQVEIRCGFTQVENRTGNARIIRSEPWIA